MNNGNEPINPIDNVQGVCSGLTKREHFAGLAMQGILAGLNSNNSGDDWHGWSTDDIARDAVSHADALLKELGNE